MGKLPFLLTHSFSHQYLGSTAARGSRTRFPPGDAAWLKPRRLPCSRRKPRPRCPGLRGVCTLGSGAGLSSLLCRCLRLWACRPPTRDAVPGELSRRAGSRGQGWLPPRTRPRRSSRLSSRRARARAGDPGGLVGKGSAGCLTFFWPHFFLF